MTKDTKSTFKAIPYLTAPIGFAACMFCLIAEVVFSLYAFAGVILMSMSLALTVGLVTNLIDPHTKRIIKRPKPEPKLVGLKLWT